MLSSVVGQITDSATFVINKKVMELRNKGVKVVNFGLGESNFGIPPSIVRNAKNAISHNAGYYGPVKGLKKLRTSISEYLKKYGLEYNADNIIMDAGSKHLIYCLMMILAEPGDEAMLQTPYWVSYYDQAILSRLNLNLLRTSEETGFKVTGQQLNDSVTEKTRFFLINSPNNPTGVMYSRKELKDIAKAAVDNGLFIISDEIYSEYTFDSEHVSIASLGQDIKERTIVTGGFSKSHSIGGWRLGFAAAEPEIIDALAKVVSNTTSCAPIISQKACVDTLGSEEDSSYVKDSVEKCKVNADYIHKFFVKEGITCVKPNGAFYIFPNVSSFFGKSLKGKVIRDSTDFAKLLLEEEMVAALPGSDFGVDSNIRLALAVPFEEVQEGCERIKSFLSKLKD